MYSNGTFFEVLATAMHSNPFLANSGTSSNKFRIEFHNRMYVELIEYIILIVTDDNLAAEIMYRRNK